MHHLARFLSPRDKSAAKAAEDPRKMRRKPRLERRNAAKHIEYDAASTSSSLDDSSSSSLLFSRSLDLLERTSFRIEGVEGEFERICRNLGLSGPDDFAIPAAAWEARTIRSSSDLLPRSRLNQLDSPKKTVERQSEAAAAVVRELSDRVSHSVRIRDEADLTRTELTQAAELSCSASGGGDGDVEVIVDSSDLPPSESTESCACCISSNHVKRIKGARPPVLKPPPGMRLPVVDNTCSTWDILRDFAPKDEITPSSVMNDRVLSSSSDDEDNEEEEEVERAVITPSSVMNDRVLSSSSDDEDNEEEEEVERAVIKREEEDMVLSESCSFSTERDDDSSSTTTEPMLNISPNGRFKRTITYWQKGELLGRGSFGSVYEGISDDGFFFAVKEVSLLDQGSQAKQSIYQLEQEIALLSQFEHENIVQYYGTDMDESKLYIFLEFVTKGSLLKLYQQYHLKDSQVSAYTRQILHGLKFLHDQNVVHRDIKCANILVDASGSVKLADFGLAKATKLNDVKSCRGTAFWMAPEVVNNKNQGYGLPADIWSLGCTVLEMLTRQIPYSPMECMPALFKIGRGLPPPIPDSLSKDAQDFIMQCLQVNPNGRPTAVHLLDHPFVKRPLATISGSASPYLGRR